MSRCEAGTRRGRRCNGLRAGYYAPLAITLCPMHAWMISRGKPVQRWLLADHDEARGIDTEREGHYTRVSDTFQENKA